jgi:ComF family protein
MEYFCLSCWKDLSYIHNEDLEVLHKKKYAESNLIDSLVSLYYFQPDLVSQRIIHSIKYENMKRLGIKMGRLLGEKIMSVSLNADYIIPVPLHKTKLKERSFNQSELISRGVSEVIQTKVITNILFRRKYTQSQTNLNKEERIQNVSNAFVVNNKLRNLMKNKSIFLLDDVITTGSTINSCAKVLKENGVKNIIALSLAYVDS